MGFNCLKAVYFLPFSFQKSLVLILSTSEGWKAESTLEPPSGFEHGTLDRESSALTTSTDQQIVFLMYFQKIISEKTLKCCAVSKRRRKDAVILWKYFCLLIPITETGYSYVTLLYICLIHWNFIMAWPLQHPW